MWRGGGQIRRREGDWYPFKDYAVNCPIIIQRGEDFKVVMRKYYMTITKELS